MTPTKRLEFTVERTIPASPREVFDAWLDPRVPGNPWNAAEKCIVDAKVDGLFYWTLKGTAHYGRFTELVRPRRLQHTWVSPNTLGDESIVTVTFSAQARHTVMTLVHSNLPDHEQARGHERGWQFFLETFGEQFGDGSRREYRWEEAHPPTTRQ
jgi:uncharacterized protein YndB with AHSA1/START domain